MPSDEQVRAGEEAALPELLPCPRCQSRKIDLTDNGREKWLECRNCGIVVGPWQEPPENHEFTGTELQDQWNAWAARAGAKTVTRSSEELLARKIEREDPYLIDYLLGWAGLAEPQPWGAAMSFALEVAHGYGLIRGESDATLTSLGEKVAAALRSLATKDSADGQ